MTAEGGRRLRDLSARDLHFELQELYSSYAGCLDDGELERWPDLFTEDCLYKCVPRENHELGLPLATWLCESRGMLQDRVDAIRQTNTYAPRYLRHLVSGIRAQGWDGDVLQATATYAVFETLADDVTRVFNVGRYLDRIVVDGDRLRFKEKLCVFDSILVPNSLVFPL